MNVVFPPTLASTFAATAEGFLCLEETCLFGWAWTAVALALLSAAVVRHWPWGGEAGRRLLRVSPAPAYAGALSLRLPGFAAPRTRALSARPVAEPAAGRSLRAPPLTFERAVHSRHPADLPCFPPRRSDRSPETPTLPDSPDGLGQKPSG